MQLKMCYWLISVEILYKRVVAFQLENQSFVETGRTCDF